MNTNRIQLPLVLLVLSTTLQGGQPDKVLLKGRVIACDTQRISIRADADVGNGGHNEQVMSIDQSTTVFAGDIDSCGVTFQQVSVGNVRLGDLVTVMAHAGRALEIRILPPPPIVGTVLHIDDHTLTIAPFTKAGTSAKQQPFRLNASHTAVHSTLVDLGPMRNASIGDITVSSTVSIMAKDGDAFVIHILPAAPVRGTVTAITQDAIVIEEAPPSERRTAVFHVRKNTEVFDRYFGEPVTSAVLQDVKVGMGIEVTSDNGAAQCICIVHPLFKGRIVSLGDNEVTISVQYGQKRSNETFHFDASRSHIYMGHEDHAVKLPSGKTAHVFTYSPDGRFSDLRIGQLVSLSANGDTIHVVRVTPI